MKGNTYLRFAQKEKMEKWSALRGRAKMTFPVMDIIILSFQEIEI